MGAADGGRRRALRGCRLPAPRRRPRPRRRGQARFARRVAVPRAGRSGPAGFPARTSEPQPLRRAVPVVRTFAPARSQTAASFPHDHRDDVASISGLRLQQAPRLGDVHRDAIPGHAELQVAGDAWTEIAPERTGGDEQEVGAFALHHLAESARPDLRLVRAELLVVDDYDDLGPAAAQLLRDLADLVPQHERDVAAAELAGKRAAPGEQLERVARRLSAVELDQRPRVVVSGRLLGDVVGLVPGRLGRRRSARSASIAARASPASV